MICCFHCIHILHRNREILSFRFGFLSDVHYLARIRSRTGVKEIDSRINTFGEIFCAKLSNINWGSETIGKQVETLFVCRSISRHFFLIHTAFKQLSCKGYHIALFNSILSSCIALKRIHHQFRKGISPITN